MLRLCSHLHDLGLVTTLGPQRDGVRFDPNLDQHHHYVCVRCGLVRDFESADHAARVGGGVSEDSGVDLHEAAGRSAKPSLSTLERFAKATGMRTRVVFEPVKVVRKGRAGRAA
jgi:hypothetical protein